MIDTGRRSCIDERVDLPGDVEAPGGLAPLVVDDQRDSAWGPTQGLGKVIGWCRSRQRLPALRERRRVVPAGFRFVCRVGSGARWLAGRAARSA